MYKKQMPMIQRLLAALVICSPVLFACGAKEDETSDFVPTPGTEIKKTAGTPNDTAANAGGGVTMPAFNPGKTSEVSNAPVTTQPVTVNPGAANAAPDGKMVISAPQQMPQHIQQMPQQVQQPTKPGMNPPHGQPGHRCEIAVGAPLNSKPVQPTATSQPVTQPVTLNAPTQAPVTANNQQPPVKTAPGMNPPHGQPGHRCDIAVGAPLNSPKAATATPPPAVLTTPPATPAPQAAPVAVDTSHN